MFLNPHLIRENIIHEIVVNVTSLCAVQQEQECVKTEVAHENYKYQKIHCEKKTL